MQPEGPNDLVNLRFLTAHTGELVSAERARTSTIDQKASGIVAIGGVVLGLDASFGRQLRTLGSHDVLKWIGVVLFALARARSANE